MVEEACIVLENTYIIISRMLVEILMLKVLLVRTPKEMRNMLWKIEERRLFLYNGENLAELSTMFMWKQIF